MRIACWAVLMVLAACGGATDGSRLVVSAASSLAPALVDLEEAYEARHPGVDVVSNLAGSSALREQILEGAPVDVYMPAGVENMRAVVEEGLVSGEVRVLGRNRLALAVPHGNPAGIDELRDLSDDRFVVAVCAPVVPCGSLAVEALANAGVEASVDTEEPNARALLGKIEAGEVDVGLVYHTDLIASGEDVDQVLVDGLEETVDYLIADLTSSGAPDIASDFVQFVLSDTGRGILASHGVDLP